MANPLAAPHQTVLSATHPPVATAASATTVVSSAPYDATVAGVEYVATADVAGAATNNRRLRLINKGANGAGTTAVAEFQFTTGNNAADFVALALTLSGTAANLDVLAGDVLALESAAVATGIADPGGSVRVTLARR